MSSILITGGAGFIGSHLAMKLSEQHEVTVVDNLDTGFLTNLPSNCKFFNIDISNRDKLFDQLSNCNFDIIFHIAGQSSGEISFDDPIKDINSNTISTLNLLDLANENNIKKIIFTSTMSVYGDVPDMPINENHICNPKSFYAVGKLASEMYLKIYKNINTVTFRLFNVYGPGQNMENMRQGMISIYLSEYFKNNQILVKGSINRYRDFIHIDDVSYVLTDCLNNEMYNNKVINLGTGVKTSVGAILKMLSKELEISSEKIIVKGGTPGDMHGIYADNSLLLKCLNKDYNFTTISDGIKDFIIHEKNRFN